MSDIITINKREITQFVKEGSQLIFTPKAEQHLIRLLDAIDQLQTALEEVKKTISVSAKKVYPDFKGIVGQDIKVMTRKYGERYAISSDNVAREFITETRIQKADTQEIELYVKEEGTLPDGITENNRKDILVITRINHAKNLL